MCTSQSQIVATEVKACPACGQSPITIPTLLGREFYAVCRGCKVETPIAKTKEAAMKLWNQGIFE